MNCVVNVADTEHRAPQRRRSATCLRPVLIHAVLGSTAAVFHFLFCLHHPPTSRGFAIFNSPADQDCAFNTATTRAKVTCR
ncbi:hypothetical protein B0T16DRAFT_172724 [Cercophora newfieldiana]|uniref:Uncharacterized protein n=1 Tax=Cercophora newfieldiana TaxID=92897 RepID=A0AA39Y9S5_9PEZI|nr:hypothetical protein B0T16DRAFT_172724 [Cercophora newfieldiana]